MAWVTAAVLRLDAAEAESRYRAQLEENVRLALWRMDSALAPLVAQEHARPAGDYFNPPSGRVQRGNNFIVNNLAAPPLPGSAPFVRHYFQLGPGGGLTA